MILNCRKNQSAHRFIFFGENGPDHNIPPEDVKAPEKKEATEKVERKEDPEAAAKAKEALDARVDQLNARKDSAEKKYDKCMKITRDLPKDSDARNTAEKACKKARETLDRVESILPERPNQKTEKQASEPAEQKTEQKPEQKADKPAEQKPEETKIKTQPRVEPANLQDFEAALKKASISTSNVIRTLNTTEKEATAAKEFVDALTKIGLDSKAIENIFKKNPEEIQDIVLGLGKFKNASKEANFKKIVAEINSKGVDQFIEKVMSLKPLSLSFSQLTDALSLNRVMSGEMSVEDLSKFIMGASENKIKHNDAIVLLANIGEKENPFKYLRLIDNQQDISSELAKIDFCINLQNSLASQEKVVTIDLAVLEALYAREKDPNAILTFLASINDLTQKFDEKIALFHLEKDPVKARELFGSLADKTKGSMESKELAGYKLKYPSLIESGLLSYTPGNQADIENTLKFGRLIDSNPGLYPFLSYEMKKASGSKTEQEEYEAFAKDPSLPLAYAIYMKLGGSVTGTINKTYPEREQYLNLARTLFRRGTKPEEISALTKEDLEKEFAASDKVAEDVSDTKLYTYTGIDKDGKPVEMNRVTIFIANNDTGNGKQVKLGADQFLSPAILEGLIVSGADIGQAKDEKGNALRDKEGNIVWKDGKGPENVFKAQSKISFERRAIEDLIKNGKDLGQEKDEKGEVKRDSEGKIIWKNKIGPELPSREAAIKDLIGQGYDIGQAKDDKGDTKYDKDGKIVWVNGKGPEIGVVGLDLSVSAVEQIIIQNKAREIKRAELVALKKSILNQLENAKPPMTLCFNGHGGGNGGLVLGDLPWIRGEDGKLKQDPDGALTADDLAKAIKVRSEKFKGDPNLSKDIYLFAACATHEMVQDILAKVQKENAVQPIISGASGHGIAITADDGQPGASFVTNQPGANVGHLLAVAGEVSGKHPYIYAPDAQGRATQISKPKQPLVAKAPAPAIKPS